MKKSKPKGGGIRRTSGRLASRALKQVLIDADLISPGRSTLGRSGRDAAIVRAATILKRARVSSTQLPEVLRGLLGTLAPEWAQQSQDRRSVVTRPSPVVGSGVLLDLRANRAAKPGVGVTAARRREQASGHYARAVVLEASDVNAAREAYAAALAAYGGHLEARINLGRLLHLAGELAAAEEVYRQAKEASATLSFNLALLLEDLKRDEEAVRAYRDALALDPVMHEAHLNLGLLHHRLEQPREALRHMLAYRRAAKAAHLPVDLIGSSPDDELA